MKIGSLHSAYIQNLMFRKLFIIWEGECLCTLEDSLSIQSVPLYLNCPLSEDYISGFPILSPR